MSLDQPTKNLMDDDGNYMQQVFPSDSELMIELNQIYDEVSTNGHALEEIGQVMHGYEGQRRPDSTEKWFWSLEYEIGCETVEVAFPWAQDEDQKAGVQNDKSIAIYASGDVEEERIDNLITVLGNRILEYGIENNHIR